MPKRFCPECNSENIKLEQGIPGTPGSWFCNECGFRNIEFPSKEEDKKEEDSKPKNKKLRNVLLIIGIFSILIIGIYFVNKTMTANAIKEQEKQLEEYQIWMAENCECLEENRPKCTLEGFVYDKTRRLCVNSKRKAVTIPGFACSKYDCSGEIKFWNNETEIWEDWINE